VASHCTCGAELPVDARFCHKCGKPQFELLPYADEAEPEPVADVVVVTPPAAAAAQNPPVPLEIGFRNPVAVRIALAMGAIGTTLSSLPIPPAGVWPLLSLLLVGFVAVFLYGRRTGTRMSIVAGARMGWLTGVFSFVFLSVLFTVLILAIANYPGGFPGFFRELSKNMNMSSAELEEALRQMEDPGNLGVFVFALLGLLFVFVTTLPMLGGALGAKLLERNRT
jgi:hypothetical protein